MRDDEDRTTGGRQFQARGAATGNDRSPKVDLLCHITYQHENTFLKCGEVKTLQPSPF